MDSGISIGEGVLWILGWFGVMLFYTLLDVAVWRKLAPGRARLLNLISSALCMGGYLLLLKTKGHFQLDLTYGITLQGMLLAAGCAAALYFLLDRFLDPLLEGMFLGSEERYQETLRHLSEAPVSSFLQVCILAPFMEELLMRGFLLGGLSANYGKVTALVLSSAVFALLHFNMVQTLSALICGVVLGLIYLRTGSVVCCITAHAGYNMISYFTMILPIVKKSLNRFDPTALRAALSVAVAQLLPPCRGFPGGSPAPLRAKAYLFVRNFPPAIQIE